MTLQLNRRPVGAQGGEQFAGFAVFRGLLGDGPRLEAGGAGGAAQDRGILIVPRSWRRAGGEGVGRTPPAGASAPGRRPRCLRPLREQVAERWSHLDVQEQFVLMVTETVAAPPDCP